MKPGKRQILEKIQRACEKDGARKKYGELVKIWGACMKDWGLHFLFFIRT